MTKYQAADQSIANYEAYVFASVGHGFSADKADALAAVAVLDCRAAARDRSVNVFTRKHYARMAVEFAAIL